MKIALTNQCDLLVPPGTLDAEIATCHDRTVRVNRYGEAVVSLIGKPAWNEGAAEWRSLANVNGALCLISLRISADVLA